MFVEPHFLDPKSSPGEPDILAHTASGDFAIQCKSHDPTSARSFPYDLWQYFAGVFHRVVQDSGRSVHLDVRLHGRLDYREVTKLAKRVAGLVRKGVSTPYALKSSLASFQLTDMGEFPRLEHLLRLKYSAFEQDGPVYDELVPLTSLVEGRHRCASLSVAGRRGEDVTEVVKKAVTSATKAAGTVGPLIVAVHLYHEIDLSDFYERPRVQSNLIPQSLSTIFAIC